MLPCSIFPSKAPRRAVERFRIQTSHFDRCQIERTTMQDCHLPGIWPAHRCLQFSDAVRLVLRARIHAFPLAGYPRSTFVDDLITRSNVFSMSYHKTEELAHRKNIKKRTDDAYSRDYRPSFFLFRNVTSTIEVGRLTACHSRLWSATASMKNVLKQAKAGKAQEAKAGTNQVSKVVNNNWTLCYTVRETTFKQSISYILTQIKSTQKTDPCSSCSRVVPYRLQVIQLSYSAL